jgi:hypothetical protein
MTESAVSFAGNLTDDPEVRSTEAGIARANVPSGGVGAGATWTAFALFLVALVTLEQIHRAVLAPEVVAQHILIGPTKRLLGEVRLSPPHRWLVER